MNFTSIQIAILALALIAFLKTGVINLFVKHHERGVIAWQDKGPTPLGHKGYTPQGMTWVGKHLVFANTWKNKRSRVYEIDPESMEELRHFDMPRGAVHTSGLAWDGKYLWAVDYKSRRAYCIKLEPSLESGEARLVGSFDTTLGGSSACCIVTWKGRRYLAISDFMRSSTTVFVRRHEALEAGTAKGSIAFAYRNEGFSQGLEFIDGYLYEAENKWGRNVINKIDLRLLEKSRSSRKATVTQYLTPARGVEDIAWSGKAIWTSDESVFRFFKGVFSRG